MLAKQVAAIHAQAAAEQIGTAQILVEQKKALVEHIVSKVTQQESEALL